MKHSTKRKKVLHKIRESQMQVSSQNSDDDCWSGRTFFWNRLNQFKFEQEYMQLYLKHCVTVDRAIMIISAVMSSSTIAVWAVTGKYAFLWGTLIALSQILMTINQFLPYHKMIPQLSKVVSEYEVLYPKIEHDLLELEFKGTSNIEYINKASESVLVWDSVTNKYLDKSIILRNKWITQKANEEANLYLHNAFGD